MPYRRCPLAPSGADSPSTVREAAGSNVEAPLPSGGSPSTYESHESLAAADGGSLEGASPQAVIREALGTPTRCHLRTTRVLITQSLVRRPNPQPSAVCLRRLGGNAPVCESFLCIFPVTPSCESFLWNLTLALTLTPTLATALIITLTLTDASNVRPAEPAGQERASCESYV